MVAGIRSHGGWHSGVTPFGDRASTHDRVRAGSSLLLFSCTNLALATVWDNAGNWAVTVSYTGT